MTAPCLAALTLAPLSACGLQAAAQVVGLTCPHIIAHRFADAFCVQIIVCRFSNMLPAGLVRTFLALVARGFLKSLCRLSSEPCNTQTSRQFPCFRDAPFAKLMCETLPRQDSPIFRTTTVSVRDCKLAFHRQQNHAIWLRFG